MSLCKGICRNKNKKCNNKHKDGSSYCGTHTSQPLGKQFQTLTAKQETLTIPSSETEEEVLLKVQKQKVTG